MSISTDEVDRIASGGGEVRTTTGEKIGKIVQVYLDDNSGRPSWVTVKTGLFGTQESFVPLGGANVEGVDVVVRYDKDTIKGAPRVDSGGSLTPQEENLLYSYYGGADQMDAPAAAAAATGARDDDRDRDPDRGRRDDDDRTLGDRLRGDRDDRDRDDDRGDDDDRSLRDRLRGDRDRDEDERASRRDDDSASQVGGEVGTTRLRKYVVTEKVVPVSSEEIAVDDDPDRR
jgi:PRC-barrel domain